MSQSSFAIHNQEPQRLSIFRPGGDELVAIDLRDGSMTFAQDYQPDEAARIFWNAMSSEYRKFLAWKAEHQ